MCWADSTGEPSKETHEKLPQLRCVELTVTGEPQKDYRDRYFGNTTCTMSDKLPQLRCVWTESTGEPSKETQKKLPQLRCVWADSTGEPSKDTGIVHKHNMHRCQKNYTVKPIFMP